MNIASFFPLYRKYQQANRVEKDRLKKKISAIFKDELQNTIRARERIEFDPQLGYHAEAQCHLMTLDDMDYKIRLLKSQI
jgi:hypothetical protein